MFSRVVVGVNDLYDDIRADVDVVRAAHSWGHGAGVAAQGPDRDGAGGIMGLPQVGHVVHEITLNGVLLHPAADCTCTGVPGTCTAACALGATAVPGDTAPTGQPWNLAAVELTGDSS